MAAYQAEVEFRHRVFEDDEPTKENIKKIAKYLTNDNQKFGMMFLGLCGNGKPRCSMPFSSLSII